MSLLRKILITISIIIMSFCFVSCSEETKKTKEIDKLFVYSVNDLHGALQTSSSGSGIIKTAGYIKSNMEGKEDQSLLISSGDMFQGTALSNYDHGETVVKIMNEMHFDCMTVGNHEFDWTINETLKYCDGDPSNGEANFPILGCNIYEKATDKIIDGLDSYAVIERCGVKIGVIGYMGFGEEKDILEEYIKDYYFADPLPIIKELATKLRKEEGCTVIITSGHDANSQTNKQIADLTGDARVDLILNGHSHSKYNNSLLRKDGFKIACMQSGTAGQYVGVSTINLSKETHEGVGSLGSNKEITNKMPDDENVKKIVEALEEETKDLFFDKVCVAGKDFTVYTGAQSIINLINDYYETDLFIINGGGFRSSAFPISSYTEITVNKVYEIYPFDNEIILGYLEGKYIKLLIGGNYYFSDSLSGTKINGEEIQDDKLYYVGTNDYLYTKSDLPFKYFTDVNETKTYLKDVIVTVLKNIDEKEETWK